jgi:hypothetical protein
MKSLKPTKIPKRIKTVDDLLSQNDVLKVFDNTLNEKPQIKEIIVIYRMLDGSVIIDTNVKDSIVVRGLLDYGHDLYVDPSVESEDE